jgi:CRISPR-associated protein Cas5t
VYGFLLSLVGEEDRCRHIGTRLAIAVVQQPAVSTVLRTAWRVKDRKLQPGAGSNRRPDYQEILTGLELAISVADGDLAGCLRRLADDPAGTVRFGGLSLGESRDLADEVKFDPVWNGQQGLWLVPDEKGQRPLPVWVDHVGSKGTRWVQFRLDQGPLQTPGEDDPCWIAIKPP